MKNVVSRKLWQARYLLYSELMGELDYGSPDLVHKEVLPLFAGYVAGGTDVSLAVSWQLLYKSLQE